MPKRRRAGERRAISSGLGACQGENWVNSIHALYPLANGCKGPNWRKRNSFDWSIPVASSGLNLDEQKAVDRFRKTVVEPSMTSLVILDFWAEWCGPCKALTPLLEKVAAEYADKGVVLAKVNVDEEQFIAAQFQVRSIPTVYALFQGQPVADLTQARTESQLKQVLDQLLAKLPVSPGGTAAQDIAPLLAMGEEALASGDAERAASIFSQIVEIDPSSGAAFGGLIRAMAAAGALEEAEAVAGAVPLELAGDAEVARARAALELARNRPEDSELAALKAAAQAPGTMDARLAYAEAAFAAGQRDEAAD
ncbi:MAG: tetratricopeptide repeat protein, partial [Novosphingobium sp.]|nr:tetratricopeptide repeat protein [Novosphingobium sp.]